MLTTCQLLRGNRKLKPTRKNSPRLAKSPQKKATCLKVYTITPKKPNSALRKVAKIKLSNKKEVVAYIPGIGHNLQKYSNVLMRGGRVKDLPGVKYHLIRGKLDFVGLKDRKTARSKYGCKKPKKK